MKKYVGATFIAALILSCAVSLSVMWNTDRVDAQAQKFTQTQLMATFPSGVIFAWYATGGSVPVGWAICDGSNGTPNLRGKMLRGVSDFADVGQPGGAESQTIVHDHTFSGSTSKLGGGLGWTRLLGGDIAVAHHTSNHHHTYSGTVSEDSKTIATLPPYDTVLFIMKL